MNSIGYTPVHGSFRDPEGFMFERDGVLYRQINQSGRSSYRSLMDSGLYDHLRELGLIIPHTEVDVPPAESEGAELVIAPERIQFMSWPFEWSFGQLKHAALTTLKIQLSALDHGMILKDASAYNIQYHKGRALLIDTLSLGKYSEGQIWEGYRQFCQHFLAPLCLMARTDIRLGQLGRAFLDGIPLDLASRLMPRATWMRPGMLMHLHLHARAQLAHAGSSDSGTASKRRPRPLSRTGLIGIVQGLQKLINSLDWKPAGTEWADYYQATNYSSDAFDAKSGVINEFLDQIQPGKVWDLGANTGHFSRLASDRGIPTVAFDIDPAAVEINFRQVVANRETQILPLVLDLTNPSPSIGWACRERDSLIQRGPTDCVMALALIHHLAISNNVPLGQAAEFFASICQDLIIEFVPKGDSQVQRLLKTRKDIFPHYDESGFEHAFSKYFEICQTRRVQGSERTLYWLRRR